MSAPDISHHSHPIGQPPPQPASTASTNTACWDRLTTFDAWRPPPSPANPLLLHPTPTSASREARLPAGLPPGSKYRAGVQTRQPAPVQGARRSAGTEAARVTSHLSGRSTRAVSDLDQRRSQGLMVAARRARPPLQSQSSISHRPSPIGHRPSPIVHRPSSIAYRLSPPSPQPLRHVSSRRILNTGQVGKRDMQFDTRVGSG